ncbi:MAG: bifunctional precorrin-2 dehydrogenase/sirohydrochlorin ferrochelatase [Methanosarcinaceae archaeon]|nr:bifunctional precorrin-2 dehydrogenase/sirohydrochlorin ferrochelatase [Methanosarcinaceae archaeon]
MIDFSGRKVMIFGGGSVGERKAGLFSPHADTTVISTGFTQELEKLGKSGRVKLMSYDVGSLSDAEIQDLVSDAFLVIPATSNALLNERIIGIANKNNVLVNQVDSIGDVVVPSVIQRGNLTIAISTLGSSPAISKYARKNIEQVITIQYEDMIRIQDEIRTYLKQNVPDQKMRKEILWKIIDDTAVWDALSDSYEKAYKIAYGIVLEHMDE